MFNTDLKQICTEVRSLNQISTLGAHSWHTSAERSVSTYEKCNVIFFFMAYWNIQESEGPSPLSTQPTSAHPAPRRHAWALSAPFFPGRAAPALSKARPFGHWWHTVRPFLKVWHVVTTPSNPLWNAKDLCRLVPDPSSAGKKQTTKKTCQKSGREEVPGQHQHGLRDFCHGL